MPQAIINCLISAAIEILPSITTKSKFQCAQARAREKKHAHALAHINLHPLLYSMQLIAQRLQRRMYFYSGLRAFFPIKSAY